VVSTQLGKVALVGDVPLGQDAGFSAVMLGGNGEAMIVSGRGAKPRCRNGC